MNGPLHSTQAQRLQRLNTLLETALALPAPQRERWLQTLQPDDRQHTDTLRAMLARAEVETDDFMHEPVDLAPLGVETVPDRCGDRVGPYVLLRELGRGGMSTVWLAERAEGELQRQVALKLPDGGWDGAGLARRMARERDILGALEHPRIARLYEAGLTPEGRPWLAMERVEGLPLDQHGSRYGLNVTQRLRLFLQIAEAVAYAHARLIVHRDLKPGNILVTAQGEVRLLDFGVAKLLQGDDDLLPSATQLTRALGRAITPDYASPEQVAGRPVTAATDVYSLGIVLYELLSGQRPYKLGTHSMLALEEAILAADVPPASSRTLDRRTAARLRGDLDTILAKALAKDPCARYASVESMAADVQRHLDGAPVLAQAPSTRYRVEKFLRRHWRAVGSAAVAVTALSAGLVVAAWQWREARDQRELAVSQLERTQAALEFSQAVLSEGMGRDEKLSLEQLLARSRKFVERTTNPVARAVSAHTLAAWFNSYGSYRDAEAVLAQARASFPAGLDPDLTQAMQCQHAHALSYIDRKPEAMKLLESASGQAQTPDTAAYCLRIRSIVARNDNDGVAAERYAQQALQYIQANPRSKPSQLAMARGDLAYANQLMGRPDLAERDFAAAIALLRSEGRDESPGAITLLNNWGIAIGATGNPMGALQRFEEALAITARRAPIGDGPAYLFTNRANALQTLGRYQEALAVYEYIASLNVSGRQTQVYALAGQAYCHSRLGQLPQARAAQARAEALAQEIGLGPLTPSGYRLVIARAQLELDSDLLDAAEETLTPVLDSATSKGHRNLALTQALLMRAEARARRDDTAGAEPDVRAALKMAQALQLADRPSYLVGHAWLQLSQLHRQQGQPAPARDALTLARQHLLPTLGAQHPLVLRLAQLDAQQVSSAR